MAKRRQQPRHSPPPPPPPRPGIDGLRIATSVAVAVVLVVSILNLRAAGRIEGDLERKLDRVEDRIAQVSNRIASQPTVTATPAQPTPPPRRGPDPERVYPIRTTGAPSKGPSSAPVVIAEFSDFQ